MHQCRMRHCTARDDQAEGLYASQMLALAQLRHRDGGKAHRCIGRAVASEPVGGDDLRVHQAEPDRRFGFGSDAIVCFLGSTKLMLNFDPPAPSAWAAAQSSMRLLRLTGCCGRITVQTATTRRRAR